MTDRSYEAEIAVIGSILIEPKCISKIVRKLSGAEFTNGACEAIYEAAIDASDRGKDYDLISAVDTAKRNMNETEAARWVLEVVDITPTAANVEQYAEIVHNYAGVRKIKDSMQYVADEEGTPREMATKLVSIGQAYLMEERTDRIKTLSDALKEMYDGKMRKSHRIDTGYPRLDRILKGLWGGNLMLVGARPGVGKSAFGVDIAATAAINGNRVALFSLEMNADEIAERLIARHSSIEMDNLIDDNINEDAWAEIGKSTVWLSKLPLLICDDPRLTVSKVRTVARTLPDLKLIVIDYISLMSSDRNYNNRNQELGSISRGLKLLAGELQIPIVALAQLNREKDETERPTLRDLRDSGELEQDANKVIFLWKAQEMPEGGAQKIGFYVAKNRRGKTGTTINLFDGSHMKFVETEELFMYPNKRKKLFED